MSVSKVVPEAGPKVTCQADVMEFPSPIKGIDSVSPSNVLTDDILVFS